MNIYTFYEFDGNEIKNIEGTSDYNGYFDNPIIYDSKLYFTGINNSVTYVYSFDGDKVYKIPKGSSGYYFDFKFPIVFNSKLYFYGHESVNTIKMFMID